MPKLSQMEITKLAKEAINSSDYRTLSEDLRRFHNCYICQFKRSQRCRVCPRADTINRSIALMRYGVMMMKIEGLIPSHKVVQKSNEEPSPLADEDYTIK